MGNLRLYKQVYRVDIVRTGSTETYNYTLINPLSITAATFTNNSNLVEEFENPFSNQTGEFFVELTGNLYSFDNIYNIRWAIEYDSSSGFKFITNNFRYNPLNIISSVDIDVKASPTLETEIISMPVELENISNNISLDATENPPIEINTINTNLTINIENE